jgi:hypothetical protein
VPAAQVVVDSSASLSLMHDVIVYALLNGVPGGQPWVGQQPVFLCPVPGYDRHFSICEARGIKMINIPLNEDGPDMDLVERLVAADPSIKGMWCVPKYSNPSGSRVLGRTGAPPGRDADRSAGLPPDVGRRLPFPPPLTTKTSRSPTS